eukprot:GHVR01147209.1.p1 GENE.GHVR01147209.1~~GHVR01147209.1.p1  ORF type:complete len:511 (+),score=105.05 GHVR01147209.1:745-2277(+)
MYTCICVCIICMCLHVVIVYTCLCVCVCVCVCVAQDPSFTSLFSLPSLCGKVNVQHTRTPRHNQMHTGILSTDLLTPLEWGQAIAFEGRGASGQRDRLVRTLQEASKQPNTAVVVVTPHKEMYRCLSRSSKHTTTTIDCDKIKENSEEYLEKTCNYKEIEKNEKAREKKNKIFMLTVDKDDPRIVQCLAPLVAASLASVIAKEHRHTVLALDGVGTYVSAHCSLEKECKVPLPLSASQTVGVSPAVEYLSGMGLSEVVSESLDFKEVGVDNKKEERSEKHSQRDTPLHVGSSSDFTVFKVVDHNEAFDSHEQQALLDTCRTADTSIEFHTGSEPSFELPIFPCGGIRLHPLMRRACVRLHKQLTNLMFLRWQQSTQKQLGIHVEIWEEEEIQSLSAIPFILAQEAGRGFSQREAFAIGSAASQIFFYGGVVPTAEKAAEFRNFTLSEFQRTDPELWQVLGLELQPSQGSDDSTAHTHTSQETTKMSFEKIERRVADVVAGMTHTNPMLRS